MYGRIGSGHAPTSEDFREFLKFFGHVRGTLRKLLWCTDNGRESLETSEKVRGRQFRLRENLGKNAISHYNWHYRCNGSRAKDIFREGKGSTSHSAR